MPLINHYYAGGPINTETSTRNIELIRTTEGKTIIKIHLDIAQDISSNKPFYQTEILSKLIH